MKEIFKKFKKVVESNEATAEEKQYAEDWMLWYINWFERSHPGPGPQPQDGGGDTPPPPPPHK